MFGCCVAGRLLETNLQQVDETHALFSLPNASTINHVCVFLLGTIPFPEGYGAAVHFLWPGKGSQLLGMLSNEKPSAIFRLRGTYTAGSTAFASSADMNITSTEDVTAILGISIEPLAQIQAQLASLPPSTASKLEVNPTQLAEKIVKHLYNYVSGFGGGGGADFVVPMSTITKWHDQFMRKIKAGGVGFLDREE